MQTKSEGTGRPVVKLSCELCAQRKQKCDKGNPCSNCVKSGVKCVTVVRQRRPRGRQGGRKRTDAELRERVTKLEGMLTNLLASGETAEGWQLRRSPSTPEPSNSGSSDHGGAPARRDGPARARQPDMSKYIGSEFWSNLTAEIDGLKEIIDESDDDDDSGESNAWDMQTATGAGQSTFDFVLCGPNSFMLPPGAMDPPLPAVQEQLVAVYNANVHAIFPILHKPSIRVLFEEGTTYLGLPTGDPACTALKSAIFFAALNTVEYFECKHRFGEDKPTLLRKYRFQCEAHLAKADLINTESLTTLQAFIIYLAACRAADSSRFSWTLLSMAVRIAYAIGLNIDDTSRSTSAYMKQIRRRLWRQLGVFDVNCSVDRGSKPLLSEDLLRVEPPLHIDDSDLAIDQENDPPARSVFCDMTFTMAMGESAQQARQNGYDTHYLLYASPSTQVDWNAFHERYKTHSEKMRWQYLPMCTEDTPIQLFTRHVIEITLSAHLLFLLRPMRGAAGLCKPPKELESLNVLNLAVDHLQKAINLNSEAWAQPYRWFVWVQWRALAIALSELCVRPDGTDVRRAWLIVERAFRLYEALIADSSKGMLWRPILKLMKKAQSRKPADLGVGRLDLSDHAAHEWDLPMAPTRFPYDRMPANMRAIPGLLNYPEPEPELAGMGWASDGLPSDSSAGAGTDYAGLAWENWGDFVGGLNANDYFESFPRDVAGEMM